MLLVGVEIDALLQYGPEVMLGAVNLQLPLGTDTLCQPGGVLVVLLLSFVLG